MSTCKWIKPILFVSPKTCAEEKEKDEKTCKIARNLQAIPTVDAKAEYENIIAKTCDRKPRFQAIVPPKYEKYTKKTNHTSPKTRAEVDIERRLKAGKNDFLKAAQEGDLTFVKLHIENGINLNVADRYGWTALMCSSQAGALDVVKYLVERGADLSVLNKQGQTVFNIAGQAGHSRIIDYLRQVSVKEEPVEVEENEDEHLSFYCKSCKSEFHETSIKAHRTSTVHLFNTKRKQPGTMYYLPESNKGFQMLLRSGWEKEQGLGPSGEGHKYPVKTVLKRDRKGLGEEQSKAKITHFGAHDESAVKKPKAEQERKQRLSTVNKEKQKKLLNKERAKERAFRLEFYGD